MKHEEKEKMKRRENEKDESKRKDKESQRLLKKSQTTKQRPHTPHRV
jgi:hypothetical protein